MSMSNNNTKLLLIVVIVFAFIALYMASNNKSENLLEPDNDLTKSNTQYVMTNGDDYFKKNIPRSYNNNAISHSGDIEIDNNKMVCIGYEDLIKIVNSKNVNSIKNELQSSMKIVDIKNIKNM